MMQIEVDAQLRVKNMWSIKIANHSCYLYLFCHLTESQMVLNILSIIDPPFGYDYTSTSALDYLLVFFSNPLSYSKVY